MASSQFYLFKDRRFYPILITQACGCFNDNLLKSALVMLITYKAVFETSIPSPLLISIINSAFVLPFIIFAGLSGQIADKYDKAKIIQVIKAVEIGIVLLSVYGFLISSLPILFLCILLMGLHSAFFGPIKYSILPDYMHRDELIAANGYVESSTFFFILIGTILGGLAVNGVYIVLILMVLIAILGFVSSLKLLPTNSYSPDLKLNSNIFKETISIIKYSTSKQLVFLAILGISWFWFLGAVILAQIPVLTKDVFKADQNVANMFLGLFSVGVGVGSFLCNKIFGNEIQTKYVFLSTVLISIFGIDLFLASRIGAQDYPVEELKTIGMFLSKLHNWRIVIDLFFIAALGGLYIVPLYAIMQCFSSPAYRARVIAANNVINSAFMILSNIFITVMFKAGCSVTTLIFMLWIVNLFVAGFIYQMTPENEIIPQPVLKRMFKFVLDRFYSVEVHGLENFDKAGKRAVIVSNHISYLDPALLAVYLPERLTFAINTIVSQIWWVKPFLKVVKTHPVDPNNPMAMKALITEVKKNKKIAIFPEGRISTTGSLMKIYEGPGMIANKSDANILPIRIDGTQFTFFSKLHHILKNKLFPKVTITILPPVKLKAPENISARDTRKFLSQRLYDIMSDMIFESSDYKKPIFQSLIDSARTYGFNHPIIMDNDNSSITYRSLLMRSYILGQEVCALTKERESLGILLPNSCATAMCFFGALAYNRVPTMLNFSSGPSNVISACKTAKVNTVFTSRRFISKADLHDLENQLANEVRIIYLEDLRKKVSSITKLKGYLASYFPSSYYNYIASNQNKDDTAVILFTSGTEGVPKAVALSHQNLQANRCQMSARIDFGVRDVAFNALPMFHCFGLMAGCILPVLGGVRTFFYPSPLHYRIIPEVIYDIGATIMFGTDTFLNAYAKYADPYDFYSIRYTFAGAEKLKPETRMLWFNKFGVRIFEGYGVTEASPVVAVNTPMHDKPGTVGRLVPKMEHVLMPVEGIKEGGKLCIKGPNVMLGYIFTDNPGEVVSPSVEKLGNGWYDTGDIVSVDNEGYVKILGRVKRFAKIAGEMVSLVGVEDIANKIDNNVLHAAVHIEDEKKGEQIILFTESPKVTRDNFIEKLKEEGGSELLIPKLIKQIQIPVLATGKINYRQLLENATNLVNE